MSWPSGARVVWTPSYPSEVVKDDTGGDADVEGIGGRGHVDANAGVDDLKDVFGQAVAFISEQDDRRAFPGCRVKRQG